MKFISLTVLLLLGLVALHSCTKDKVMPNEPVDMVTDPDCPDTIFFSTDIQPLIMSSCATSGCHNSSGAGGYVLQNHSQISSNAQIMLSAMRHEPGVVNMPLGGSKLSADQIKSFKCWIDAGKLNN